MNCKYTTHIKSVQFDRCIHNCNNHYNQREYIHHFQKFPLEIVLMFAITTIHFTCYRPNRSVHICSTNLDCSLFFQNPFVFRVLVKYSFDLYFILELKKKSLTTLEREYMNKFSLFSYLLRSTPLSHLLIFL